MLQASLAEDGTNRAAHDVLASVVICTRNRSDLIGGAVRSMLYNTNPRFELVVIDQSTDGMTARALEPFLSDARVRYVPTSTRGLGMARALGVDLARGAIVLMTDDDCDVPADWVERMVAFFERSPQIAVVFCDVTAGPHDDALGFVPIALGKDDRLITNLREWCAAGGTNTGIGAGMGVRRAVAQQIGNFDPGFGAGTRFFSNEETDLSLRALLRGHHVYRTTQIAVRHHGFRTFAEGRDLMRGYMLGNGAMHAKLLKGGSWGMAMVWAFELWRTVLGPLLHDVVRLRKPPVLGRALALIRGSILGLRTPVDRANMLFLDESA
jgi:GT2 family glycosyltransferase